MIRSLLIDHLRKTPGAAAHASADTDHLGLLKAKLALSLAETGNLRREVQRLRSELSKASREPDLPSSVDPDAVSIANLYVLLALVIGRAETFAIDVAKKSIIDLGAKPSEQLVAGPERASDFIAWIRNEPGLPFIKNVRLKA